MSKLPYLNLGCGYTFHRDWTNIDFVSNSEEVIAHNLLKGIPAEDGVFELVYHSHVLEHFPKKDAAVFIQECCRVLRNGGVVRVAIPDLEVIARNYVKFLEESLNGIPGSEAKYNWTMLEMYDQVIRSKSGGGMLDYLRQSTADDQLFLLERNGKEVKDIIESLKTNVVTNTPVHYSFVDRLKSLPSSFRNRLVKLALGSEYDAYEMGKFRKEGEIHQWMYDRFSLKRMLEANGFRNAEVKTGFESNIPNWSSFNLDGTDNVLRKPDSLFMEAIKS